MPLLAFSKLNSAFIPAHLELENHIPWPQVSALKLLKIPTHQLGLWSAYRPQPLSLQFCSALQWPGPPETWLTVCLHGVSHPNFTHPSIHAIATFLSYAFKILSSRLSWSFTPLYINYSPAGLNIVLLLHCPLRLEILTSIPEWPSKILPLPSALFI